MRDNKRDILFALVVSLIAHMVLFFMILFLPKTLSSKTDFKERVIVTRLVALGVPRSEKIMPRLSANAEEPSREIVISTDSKSEESHNRSKVEKRRDEDFSKRLLSSINKVKRMVSARDGTPPVGDPKGSPYGDSADGQEGDIYLTEIYNRIKSNYVIPDIINERERKELKAIVIIYIDSDGTLLKYEFEKKSGNIHFDNALINAIRRSSPFKPPPRERARIYKMDGIGIKFSIE